MYARCETTMNADIYKFPVGKIGIECNSPLGRLAKEYEIFLFGREIKKDEQLSMYMFDIKEYKMLLAAWNAGVGRWRK